MKQIKWNLEICKKEATKYKTRGEFRSKSNSSYSQCVKNKWLDIVCSHMTSPIKPKKYWNLERCKKEALKYKTRSEFSKAKGCAYRYALLNGFIDDICGHMITVGNFKKRCVYAYEFENNFVYVGLTHDMNERWSRRINDKKDSVTIFIKKTKLKPKVIKLTDYIDKDNASKLEGDYLNEYIKNGWNVLNKVKTGSLGGSVITVWTKDECKKEALKYKNLLHFRKNNNTKRQTRTSGPGRAQG